MRSIFARFSLCRKSSKGYQNPKINFRYVTTHFSEIIELKLERNCRTFLVFKIFFRIIIISEKSVVNYAHFCFYILYTPSLALKRKTLGDTHPVPSLVCVPLFFFFFAFIIFTVFQNIAMLFSRQAIESMGFYCFA